MGVPKPGGNVRGSRTGRPIMALLDLLGRRWTLRILWELRGGALTFRALASAAGGPSPTVLNTRIGELREVGLLRSGDSGYELTEDGRDLYASLEPLARFAERWGRRPD